MQFLCVPQPNPQQQQQANAQPWASLLNQHFAALEYSSYVMVQNFDQISLL